MPIESKGLPQAEAEKEAGGIILHLEKMALFDGEGMRTVVFLKGCPLRCRWCSTPESQDPAPELGYDPRKCTVCRSCVAVCPREAITVAQDETKVEVDPSACDLCFECVEACPSKARKAYGRRVTARRIVEEVEKDDIFYFHSGGGVTISGGEPLVQAAFVKEILVGCRERGMHTAIETSGYAAWNRLEEVLPFLDTVIVDIKIMDSARHKEFTGQSNELILENIRKIDESEFPLELFIRVPLIPGINDSEEDLLATAEFCKGLRKFKELHILPYHRLGVESYRLLNREYPLDDLQSLDMRDVEEKVERLRREGIPVKIGG